MEPCFVEESSIASEIAYMQYRKSGAGSLGQLVVVNLD